MAFPLEYLSSTSSLTPLARPPKGCRCTLLACSHVTSPDRNYTPCLFHPTNAHLQAPDSAAECVNVADLADSFSRAASGTLAAEQQRSRRGRSGGRRDERYYEDVEQESSPAARHALTNSQVSVLRDVSTLLTS